MTAAKEFSKVFVYGTLKKGEPNHYLMTDVKNGVANFINGGTSLTKFPLIIATKYNIPFLLNKTDLGHNVSGEIYEVDQPMLLALDELEDYPKLYDRMSVDVEACDG